MSVHAECHLLRRPPCSVSVPAAKRVCEPAIAPPSACNVGLLRCCQTTASTCSLNVRAGGSRPSSAGAYSRPGSAAEGTVAGAYERQLSTAALGAIPEEASATVPAARGRSPQRQQHAGVAPAAAAVAAAAAPQQQQQQVAAAPPPAAPEVSARFDEDGFLLDGSVDVEASQEVSKGLCTIHCSPLHDVGSAVRRMHASTLLPAVQHAGRPAARPCASLPPVCWPDSCPACLPLPGAGVGQRAARPWVSPRACRGL